MKLVLFKLQLFNVHSLDLLQEITYPNRRMLLAVVNAFTNGGNEEECIIFTDHGLELKSRYNSHIVVYEGKKMIYRVFFNIKKHGSNIEVSPPLIEDILYDLHETERLINFQMYDAAARSLRTTSELFTKELAKSSNIPLTFPNQERRLLFLQNKSIIPDKLYNTLNQIRLLGNESAHKEKSKRKINVSDLKKLYLELKSEVQRLEQME